MKFPKWNHPWLCQQLLYLPAYLLLLLAPIGAVLLEACGIDVPGIPFLIVFFILGGCAIWYLFSQAPFLISVDLLSAEIHAWQRDRLPDQRPDPRGRGAPHPPPLPVLGP